MRYEEFKRQLGKASLSVRDFAGLMKLTPASVSNYSARGKVPDRLAVVAALIAEMVDKGVNYRSVFQRVNLSRNKPRGASAKRRAKFFSRARLEKSNTTSPD